MYQPDNEFKEGGLIMKKSFCSVRKNLKIFPGKITDYESLARFHYRDSAVGPVSNIFVIADQHPQRKLSAGTVGVIVYCMPAPNNAARNIATDGFFTGLDRASSLQLLNNNLRTMSRLIIEPRYRGLGLASWLVAETMDEVGTPMIEAISVMGKTHPFLKQAGMTEYSPPADPKTEKMRAALEMIGIDEACWTDSRQVHQQIETLNGPKREFIEQHVGAFLQKFQSQRNMPHCFERTDFLLSKLCDAGNYYLWQNPENPCRIRPGKK
jgi:GNAT superfamily N-acetyltransferase